MAMDWIWRLKSISEWAPKRKVTPAATHGIISLSFTERAHVLISAHRENVDECPISVSDQGSIKDRPHRDRVDRHPAVVVEALLSDSADKDIAKSKNGNSHQ